MIGDACQDIGKPGLRIDVVEPRGLDERLEHGGALTSTVGAAEQPCLPAEWHAAEGTFGGVVGQTYPAVVEEASKGDPAAQHVVYGLGEIMVARQLGELAGQPDLKLGNEWRAQFLTNSEPLGRTLAAQAAFDVEQGIEPLHSLQRNRIDHARALAPTLPACRGRNIGQLEELAPCVGEAAGLEHQSGLAACSVELAITAIGVGLQDP